MFLPLVWWGALALAGAPHISIDHIRKAVIAQTARLPNYTCTETIDRSTKKPNVSLFQPIDRVRLEVAVIGGREVFGWPGGEKIAEDDITRLVTGFISSGDFAALAGNLFTSTSTEFHERAPDRQSTADSLQYDYRVPVRASNWQLRINRDAFQGLSLPKTIIGYSGSFRVHRDSLELIELEIGADEIPAWLGFTMFVRKVQYAQTRVGSSNFVLPRQVEMLTKDLGGQVWRNQVRFHDCRQYHAKSVLFFGEPMDLTSGGAAVVKNPSSRLPRQFKAELALETPIDSDTGAVGDPVTARLQRPIRLENDSAIPAGSLFYGRITRLEVYGGRWRADLQFTTIEVNGARVDINARKNHVSHTRNSVVTGGPGIFGNSSRLRLRRGFKLFLGSEARQ
jgi:hypothetical protein